MGIIDADAHVIETERTWSFMLGEERRFAPELLVSTRNGVEYWRIDERVFPNSNLGLNVPEESRDLTDVSSRRRPHGLIRHRHPGSLSLAFFTAADGAC